MPQWSPVVETGSTSGAPPVPLAMTGTPQWSPVVETGSTLGTVGVRRLHPAAMEPGRGDRVDGGRGGRGRVPGLARRNGARSWRPGRRGGPRPVPHLPVRAAMEPGRGDRVDDQGARGARLP